MNVKPSSHPKVRLAVGVLALLIGFGAVFGMISLPVAGSDLDANNDTSVHLDDPANDTVAVDVNYTEPVDATVALTQSDGTVIESQTITGEAGNVSTFELHADYLTSGDYEINFSSPDTANVTVEETRLISERSVWVSDADNQTLLVDIEYSGDDSATTDIDFVDEFSNRIDLGTQAYTTSDETVQTHEFNASDGVADGDGTVIVSTSEATEMDSAFGSVQDAEDDSIVSGGITDTETTKMIAVVLIVLGGAVVYREVS